MSNSLIHKKSVQSLNVTRAAPCFQILDELLHVDLVHEDEVPEAHVGVQRHDEAGVYHLTLGNITDAQLSSNSDVLKLCGGPKTALSVSRPRSVCVSVSATHQVCVPPAHCRVQTLPSMIVNFRSQFTTSRLLSFEVLIIVFPSTTV